jgi:iron complex outermembrane receptor protein
MTKNRLSIAVGGICACWALGHGPLAVAQSAPAAGVLEEITVTARKREESLQEIPLSLSVFGQEALQAADIRDLEGVSNFTPGFQFMNQGNQQPGRYNTQLQFRGLTTAQFSPSFATGALFIDGQYVLNGGTSLSLMDIERVEVIKGPQAAYFGRNTFGGAVNLITRDPNMEELAGEVSARTTNRGRNEISGIVEMPLVKDVLSASLSGRFYDKQGHYYATDGGRTGDEETTAYNAVIKWNATENLEFKVRYAYSEDDDGAPAQGFVSGILNDSCTGLSIQTAEGVANPTRYICGDVPYGGNVQVDPGAGAISSNTFLPAFPELQQLTDSDALVTGLPSINDIGLKRETERLSLFGTYLFQSGYTLDVSYSKNEQAANSIRDFDNSDRVNFFSADPQRMDDESWEIRLSGPQDGRLRWLVGYNYYEQEFISSGEGGNATSSCFAAQQAPLLDNYPAGCIGGAPGVLNLFFPLGLANTDQAEVEGFFAAADFDITDTLTLSVEGRLQEDTLTKGSGLLNPGAPILEETFDDFLPRVILRWTPTEATNIWVSYSEGMIAGDFNATFVSSDERERAQFLAIDPRLSESLDAETLDA